MARCEVLIIGAGRTGLVLRVLADIALYWFTGAIKASVLALLQPLAWRHHSSVGRNDFGTERLR
jgi:hypothetical protein